MIKIRLTNRKFGSRDADAGELEGSAKRLIEQISRLGFENPLNYREIVMDGVKIELHTLSDTRVWLKSLEAMDRGHGHGTKALLRVTALADLYGASLELDSVAYLDDESSMSSEELTQWYCDRGGFGHDATGDDGGMPWDDDHLVRHPLPGQQDGGSFYGTLLVSNPPLDRGFLASIGVEVGDCHEGIVPFRGGREAVSALLDFPADYDIAAFAYRPDYRAEKPLEAMAYHELQAEVLCQTWRVNASALHEEGAQARLAAAREQLQSRRTVRLSSPLAEAGRGNELSL